jgi:hypothetical protein
MRGAPPKNPALRQRRNRKTTAATLTPPTDAKVPPLPLDTTWHESTIAEWCLWWSSAMASQWEPSDYWPLVRLAMLLEDLRTAETPHVRVKLLAELRHQAGEYGFSPLARSRLHWQIATTAKAERQSPPQPKTGGTGDPRAVLGKQSRGDNVIDLRPGVSA